jgi:hypothetical protein
LLLAEYEDTIGAPIKLPVPVDDITTYHLALRLGFDDLHKTLNRPMLRGQPDILGAIWVEKELVLIDRHLDPKSNPSILGRYRFSVAHEVGHWRLHRSYVARDPDQTALFEAPTEPTVICRISQENEPIEWQANFFASCLLTRRALELLGSKRNDAYETALAALREDTQAWWADTLACDPDELGEGEEPVTADVEGLRRFLEGEVLPWFENRQKELANRPLIREQAFGEALDPDKLERLGRYEVHLDRKLERMLTMLLRLKDLRRTTVEG